MIGRLGTCELIPTQEGSQEGSQEGWCFIGHKQLLQVGGDAASGLGKCEPQTDAWGGSVLGHVQYQCVSLLILTTTCLLQLELAGG